MPRGHLYIPNSEELPEEGRAEYRVRVAEYLLELPLRELLESKLHGVMRLAHGQMEAGRVLE